MRSIGVTIMFLFLVSLCACASQETVSGEDAAAINTSASSNPLTGIWTGDWGPSADYRNIVTMDLTWDGGNLMGTVNPGPNAIAITTGSFAPDTGMLTMEANGNSAAGMVHYVMEGKLVDGVITGTWTDGDKKNDFKIKKS